MDKAFRDLMVGARAIYRCNGTNAEVDAYLETGDGNGWDIPSRVVPRRGDLLLGVTAELDPRLVVDLSKVTGVGLRRGGGYFVTYEMRTALPIKPGVPMRQVLTGMNTPVGAAWNRIDGQSRIEDLLRSLSSAINAPETSFTEGEQRIGWCRTRSRPLRRKALEAANGRCYACGSNLRDLFGRTGDRALECHHKKRMSKAAQGTVTSTLKDVVILCAVCHRLVHIDDKPDIRKLRAQWRQARRSTA